MAEESKAVEESKGRASGARAYLNPSTLAPALCLLYFAAKYRSPAYACVGAAVLAGFYALYFGWDRMRFPFGFPGTFALAALGLGLPALGLWQFMQFADLGDADHSAYACHLWNLRHGILHYSFRDMNLWGIHSQYTSALWVPVHWMAGEAGLKLGQGLCLGAAALLLAWRSRSVPNAAAWAAAAVLISPPVASQFFYGFHPEFIAAPALVLALCAYRDGRLGRFLFWTLFMACSKEVFTLAVGGILLVAMAERRNWKWILLPGLLCCLVMGVYWFLVVPRFAPAGNHLSFMMPTSLGQVASSWIRIDTALYFLHVFLPLLPLLWIMPKRYWLMPLPLMVFYSAFPDPAFMVMWVNYGFPLTLLCMGGLVLANGKEKEKEKADGRILMACAVASLLSYPLWREAFSVPAPHPLRKEVLRVQRLIPEEASVVVNGPFMARFTGRKRGEAWGWNSRPLEEFDYVVADTTYTPGWLVQASELREGLLRLSLSPEWKREPGEEGLIVYRHVRRHVSMHGHPRAYPHPATR
jgi:predicted membrane protein DUF2079